MTLNVSLKLNIDTVSNLLTYSLPYKHETIAGGPPFFPHTTRNTFCCPPTVFQSTHVEQGQAKVEGIQQTIYIQTCLETVFRVISQFECTRAALSENPEPAGSNQHGTLL